MNVNQNLNQEFQFILECCKSFSVYSLGDQVNSIKISQHLKEDSLYSLLQRHRVSPLVSFYILNSNSFSESFKKRLSVDFSNNQLLALTNRRFEFLFEKFIVGLNIFGFTFKGLSLAEVYYGDIAMRQVYDVDIYVEQASLLKVHEWLLGLGYREKIGLNKMSIRQKNYIIKTGHDLAYFTDDKSLPAIVELHWRLKEGLGGFSLQPKVNLNQVDEFLYLCVHGTEHAWFRLKWLCDILLIIKSREFDWGDVKRRAGELNCMAHLCISWLMMNKYFQIKIPIQIQEHINANHYQTQIRFVTEALFLNDPYRNSRVGKLKHLLFLYSLNSRKLSIINFSKIFTSHNDWKLIKMPDSLFFMYYILRPFLWIYRGLLSILR